MKTPEQRMSEAQDIAATVISDAMLVGTFHAIEDIMQALTTAAKLTTKAEGKQALLDFQQGLQAKRLKIIQDLEDAGANFDAADAPEGHA